MRAMKFKIARSDRFVAIARQSHGVDLLNKTLKTITITCLQLIPLHRPYRCCVLSKNVSQLLFQLLSWSEDNTKALVRFFGSAHQRYDYTWFIVLIVFVFLVICKTWWKATSTLKRISIHIEMIWNAVQYPQNVASSTYKIRIQQVIYSGFTETILATRKDTDIFMRKR